MLRNPHLNYCQVLDTKEFEKKEESLYNILSTSRRWFEALGQQNFSGNIEFLNCGWSSVCRMDKRRLMGPNTKQYIGFYQFIKKRHVYGEICYTAFFISSYVCVVLN